MLLVMMDLEMLRVFHPTDCSKESVHALAHAVRIAVCGDARLTILHVTEPNGPTRWDETISATELLERWEMLPEAATSAADLGMEIDTLEMKSDDVVRGILHYLERSPADLIVLGTHGRQGWQAWFAGSVAEPVARVSRAMALFVRHGSQGFVSLEDGTVKLDKVLVPVVVEPSAELALRAARSLPRALGVSDAQITACYIGDPGEAPIMPDEVPLIFRSGSASEQIVAIAKETHADLIVMATEGRHGVLDAFRGSTTERVLRESPCPVLAVPAK